MKIRLIFLLLVFIQKTYSQSTCTIQGTIIAVAVVNDSIVMVSDSRAGLGATDITCKDAVAYIDSLPKIFKIKDFLIATSGEAMIGPNFVNQIINDFNLAYSKKLDFKTCILTFQSYLDSLYPTSKYPASASQAFIAAGFYNKIPHTITFNRSLVKATTTAFNTKGINSNEPQILNYLMKYEVSSFDCKSVGKALEKSIYDFAKDSRKAACIGGPISIVKIVHPGKIIWIQNNFMTHQYTSFGDFFEKIKNGVVMLFPLVENGRELAIKHLQKNPNYKTKQ